MEVSAIMNIHELALNRHVKQKPCSMNKGESKTADNGPFITDRVDPGMHTVQPDDGGEVTHEHKHITGHMINIIT